MSMVLTWTTLRFPREVTPTQGLAALLALNGLSTPRRRRDVIVLQVTGSLDGIIHQLGMASDHVEAVTHQLQTAIPGLSMMVDGTSGHHHRPRLASLAQHPPPAPEHPRSRDHRQRHPGRAGLDREG